MNGNISKEGVDLDLAWMKRVGVGGFQNFDAALETPQVVPSRVAYFTPEWKAIFKHTAELADELDLEMGIASSPGWSETGGPWVKPEQAMKKLVWSETPIVGGKPFTGKLAAPPNVTGPFQDVPAVAGGMAGMVVNGPIPTFYGDSVVIAYRTLDYPTLPQPVVTSSAGAIDGKALTDSDLKTKVQLPPLSDKSTWILYDYGSPQSVRSAVIALGSVSPVFGGANKAALEASDDGVTFRPVIDIAFGQTPEQTATFASVTARYFRLSLRSGPLAFDLLESAAPGVDAAGIVRVFKDVQLSPPAFELAEFRLSAEPRVNQFELKAGFGVALDYYALESKDRATVLGVATSDVIDLTNKMAPDGTLTWTPPPGRWTVVRYGYSLIGTQNHPATVEATGLEVDKLNADDVRAYVNTYLDRYTEFLGPDLIGKHGVRAMVNDSTEVGAQNWTNDILAEFQKRRGYDPRPWLPTLSGVIVGDGVKSDAFLYDFRKTLAELTAENHYAVVAEVAHRRGLITYGEALEDHRPSLGDDLEMRRYATIPMSAMWSYKAEKGPKPTYLADDRGAASVAHIFGQNLVAAESMTSSMAPWNFAPRDLKPIIDLEFSLGINRPVIHTSVHQPLVDKKPGLTLAIFGQYFNRNDTWAEYARPWVDYISRNAFMLQQGRYFADVAYFSGEEAPLTGLYGDKETADLPKGYAFDYVNAEILAHQLRAENGELVAPSGVSYRLLYLGGNSQRMTLATLKRIRDLVIAGAVVAGPRPLTSPSLANDQAEFNTIANTLWARGKVETGVGKGRVIAVADPDLALARLNVAKDFDATPADPAAKIMFVHRKLADGDIYYLDNRSEQAETLDARFRITGRAPELWRAETGANEPLSYATEADATKVPLTLNPNESVFVVFRAPAAAPTNTVPQPAETNLGTIQGGWDVAFEPDRGAPKSVRFEGLKSWTENADPRVKYFSGAGTYTRKLTISPSQLKPGGRMLLDLGDVRDLAEVRVNGVLVGSPWHAPYRVDATDALKIGENDLEIKVVNTWVNRLIGDKQPGAVPVAFTVTLTYAADAPLRPSGLLGPVRLLRVGPAPERRD